ncbi:peroxisomal membrane protein 4 [Metschnikowia bicuspidata var. bicuspidata NRRL YB-4993]|uniref:Peroxisomal membrane protein 4 n=1 Tax=Metschnikowia bicuspidata var. bicuspidata NRRL YB-4993 TaxID=869754 RepID=A0A1A0H5L7_9ASCO|nr:peroxisomal membrane protein 4 [Metschnikowia bicuspidata var. bicuspidata NRRL YB-4993]OBA19208.1 peroxisomal membrane protein 4 [Metschnikowia bicuspidata var. bicuspidata NRRL YB-4993]
MTILTDPFFRPLLEIVQSSRNGVVYGGKIRFSHALVINLLYRSGPLVPRLKQVFKATKDHSAVLAAFATIYKTVVNLLKKEQLLSRRPSFVKFVAGAVAGWVVYSQHFGYFNPGITHQITLYCFSRVLVAACKIFLDLYLQCRQPMFTVKGEAKNYADLTPNQSKRYKAKVYNKTWKYFAVLTWALVMFIYDYQPEYLQSSLRHSMAYIYDVEMDTWASWKEFLGIHRLI